MKINFINSIMLLMLFNLNSIEAQTIIWNKKCHPQQRETYAVTFSNDGTKILSGSECSQAHLRVWDVNTGNMNWEYEVDSATMCLISVKFSSNGTYFGTVEETGKLLVFDNTTSLPTLMYNVNIGSGGSYSLDFSPDNMKVAVDGDDGKIRIFDITNSNLLNTLNGHTAAITNIDWSNNGNFILSGGIDSTLIVWNATTGDQIHYFNLNQPIVSAKISHDNSKLIAALADSSIKIFDAVTFSELSSFTSTCPLLQVDLSYDNSFVAAGCDTSTLVFDAVTGTLISNFNIMNGGRVYSVAFQPNSYNLVTGTHNGDVVFWSMQGVLSTSAIQLNKTDYLFPNPATEYLYVDVKETLTTFSIVDFEGKTILNGTTNGSINVRDLKEGLYHIFIKEDEKERIMKFIKKAN